MRPLRVLVADDERPARQWLRTLLEREPGVELVGESADGPETVRAARALDPDVILLDVCMPGLDGFEVLGELERKAAIVFVSAHDAHAVRAFEVAAVDYLLKPFDDRRLHLALERVRAAAPGRREGELLIAAAGGRVAFLRFEEIDRIEAAGNYLRVHVGRQVHLGRGTLEGLEARAEAQGFVRVHRSHLVRLGAIRALETVAGGELELVLADGTRLRVARRLRAGLRERLAGSARPRSPSAGPGDDGGPSNER